MPVVFRCFYCRGKLSIARRKAGQDVTCPRCQAIITVPAPDDLGDQLTQLLSSTHHRPLSAVTQVEPAMAPAGFDYEPPSYAEAERPPPGPVRTAPRLRANGESPLFEGADIDQLLASKVGPDVVPVEKPVSTAPAVGDYPGLVTEDAFVVSRAKATMLMLAAALAVGLAFAAGFVAAGM